jgi:hypothetical protein
MGRIVQPKGDKGSLKWIQYVVNDHPDILNRTIDVSIGVKQEQPISGTLFNNLIGNLSDWGMSHIALAKKL